MNKMAKTKENTEVCECGQYCLRTICESSDSGLIVKLCWCAECKERVAEVKANA
jgi:hypothetical protein